MTEKSFDEMTSEEQMAEVRRRSPAMAFAQDSGWLPGAPPKLPEAHLNLNEAVPLSGPLAAAIETNRSELLSISRGQVEGGKPLSLEDMNGLYAILKDFYKRNAQEPILTELLETLRTVRERLGVPTVEDSLFLLDKLRVILETFDHRRREVQEGSVPIDQIPDGQARAVPF